MSNGTRKQWMFLAACGTVVVLINLWMIYMNASTSRLIQETNEKLKREIEEAKSKYEQAINERSLD